MKKRITSLLIALMCFAVCFSGCGLGSYIENGGNRPAGNNPDNPVNPDNPDNPNNPDNPDNPSVPTDNDYKLSVYYQNQLFNPGDLEIKAVWRNDNEVVRVDLGQDGRANAGALDGSYDVYLEGLPDKYAYNPQASSATTDSRSVAINLVDITSPISGTGMGLYQNSGCYVVRYDGTYRATVKSEWNKVYFEYQPTAAGVYSVVSWVSVNDDAINPQLDVYGGTIGYKWFLRTVDAGGYSRPGGFTKNFRYECRVDKTEVGSTFTFAVGAQVKDKGYPVNVDFAITYEGTYTSEDADVRIIRAQEAYLKAAEPGSSSSFVWADMGTRVFRSDNYKFNEDTGVYHRYDEELYADDPYGYGAGYGPMLMCSLTQQPPCFSVTSLYSANFVGLGQNFLVLYNVWIEEEQRFAVYNYTYFIRTDYIRVSNSAGMCYVTKELKDFLTKFALNHSLYTDGVGAGMGTPEANGYTANSDAVWLFACGFYE